MNPQFLLDTHVVIRWLSETKKLSREQHRTLDDAARRGECVGLTTDVAREVAALGDGLRDPADRVIVATARVHRLRLMTSDQRIIESNLVPVTE